MLKKLKKLFFISILAIVVIGLLVIGSPTKKASADSADNLKKSLGGIFVGWSEVAIYPMQEASKPGWLGKIMLPANIVVGAVKATIREIGGAADLLTFFKEKNVVDSWPGEKL